MLDLRATVLRAVVRDLAADLAWVVVAAAAGLLAVAWGGGW